MLLLLLLFVILLILGCNTLQAALERQVVEMKTHLLSVLLLMRLSCCWHWGDSTACWCLLDADKGVTEERVVNMVTELLLLLLLLMTFSCCCWNGGFAVIEEETVVVKETWLFLLMLRKHDCCWGGDMIVVVEEIHLFFFVLPVLTKEYYSLQMAMEKWVVEMETQLMLFLICWPKGTTPCRQPWRSEWWRWRLSWCCCCSSDVDQGVLRPADSHGEASGGDGDSAVREDRQAGHLWAAGERNGWCHTAGSWRLADALLAGWLVWLVAGWSGWWLAGWLLAGWSMHSLVEVVFVGVIVWCSLFSWLHCCHLSFYCWLVFFQLRMNRKQKRCCFPMAMVLTSPVQPNDVCSIGESPSVLRMKTSVSKQV